MSKTHTDPDSSRAAEILEAKKGQITTLEKIIAEVSSGKMQRIRDNNMHDRSATMRVMIDGRPVTFYTERQFLAKGTKMRSGSEDVYEEDQDTRFNIITIHGVGNDVEIRTEQHVDQGMAMPKITHVILNSNTPKPEISPNPIKVLYRAYPEESRKSEEKFEDALDETALAGAIRILTKLLNGEGRSIGAQTLERELRTMMQEAFAQKVRNVLR